MQFPFIYLIVFCLLVILFLVWYIQRTKQRKKFLEQEDKQEETQKLLSQKENEIRKLADEKAQLCNVIFKETSIYKTIERLSRQDKTKNKQDLRILLENEQKKIRSTIMEIYKDYIEYLHQTYPKYTEDDCLFSCLSICGLDDFTIALCFGNVNKQIVAQRRHRIKLKVAN